MAGIRVRYAVLAALIGAGCSAATAPSPAPSIAGTHASSHFTFQYSAIDAANIVAIADAVEREYARIVADLRATAMPTVNVTFYTDHATMEAATRALAGIVPAWTAGLVTSSRQIHLMSPNLPAWGPFDRMLSHLVHEFAHCVSLHINPRIGNNPRWLWESVAIYESGQRVDLRAVPYMVALTPPDFATLSGFDNTRIYDVGYSIAEFIVSRWGQAQLVDLVLANGDTAAILGISLADFQRDWFAFARQRYGF